MSSCVRLLTAPAKDTDSVLSLHVAAHYCLPYPSQGRANNIYKQAHTHAHKQLENPNSPSPSLPLSSPHPSSSIPLSLSLYVCV